MCLIIDNNIHRKHENSIFKILLKRKYGIYSVFAKVAEKDIETIKYLREITDEQGNKKYIAPFKDNFSYKLGKLYEIENWQTEQFINFKDEQFTVNEGFHSCFEKYPFSSPFLNETIVKCKSIIPKGANYFVGTRFDIVSDKIIVEEVIETVKDTSYISFYSSLLSEKGKYKKKKKKRNKKIRK